ncbi:hypothetical protein ABAC460_03625 [Asticcacaulis sp. AC460]|uniref:hypothetical protein n=1 Tax=Asticcacaulis sp. AC460 TaxID=1282360 RepID=UPI0003C3E2FA|nr:hypothetical protein [Asticcacaulis sp. AC460]ESQ91999.1 hypothetical protein ABAC460_03625 [Asticcacaulis sp. AC460]
MTDRPLAERDRYYLTRPITPDFFYLLRLIAGLAFFAFLFLEPEHRLAKALIDAANRCLTFITTL